MEGFANIFRQIMDTPRKETLIAAKYFSNESRREKRDAHFPEILMVLKNSENLNERARIVCYTHIS